MGDWTDSVRPMVQDFLSDDRYLVAIVEATARRARDGHEERWEFMHRWRAEEDLIVEFRAFVDDQRRYDEFYAPADPG
jgi:hypothetical protein